MRKRWICKCTREDKVWMNKLNCAYKIVDIGEQNMFEFFMETWHLISIHFEPCNGIIVVAFKKWKKLVVSNLKNFQLSLPLLVLWSMNLTCTYLSPLCFMFFYTFKLLALCNAHLIWFSMFNLGIAALGVAIHHTSIRIICKDWEIRV